VLFRDAQTQDDKVKAILKSMVELDAVGQRLQSLRARRKILRGPRSSTDPAGQDFCRRHSRHHGEAQGVGDGIYPAELVNRAKAGRRSAEAVAGSSLAALKPTWDDLADTILTIKGYWADVVDLIAKAVEYTNKLSGGGLESLKSELAAVQDARANGTGLGGIPRIPGADKVRSLLGQPSIDESLRGRAEDLQRRIDALEGRVVGPPKPEVPSRGTGDKPTPKGTGGRDPFETAVDNTEKRIATLKAEAATIDETTAARERAKTVAQLEEAAKRANTAAGLKNTEVTAAQRVEIEKEADALAKAAAQVRASARLRRRSSLRKAQRSCLSPTWQSRSSYAASMVTTFRKRSPAPKRPLYV
jgi:hypothetical protein